MHQKLYFCLVFLKTLVETNKNLLLTARCLVFFSRWFVIAKIVLNSFCSHLHLGVLFRHWQKPENRNEFLEAVMFLWKGERKSFFTSFLRPVTNCPLIPIYANKSLVLPRPDKQNDYWFPTCLFFMRGTRHRPFPAVVCVHITNFALEGPVPLSQGGWGGRRTSQAWSALGNSLVMGRERWHITRDGEKWTPWYQTHGKMNHLLFNERIRTHECFFSGYFNLFLILA